MSADATDRVKPGGFAIALLGFLLTRYTVASSLWGAESLGSFLVGKATFLVVGLGLSLAGVVLAVGPRSRAYVRTVTWWCVVGAGAMGLVVSLTLAENALGGTVAVPDGFVSRVLLGGAIGGLLTGLYAARTRAHRDAIGRYADRLTVLNRLLRHEVLNKVNVVQGYADADTAADTDAETTFAPIRRNARHIERAIDAVGVLTREEPDGSRLALRPFLESQAAAAREVHPAATVRLGDVPDVAVVGTDRLAVAVDHLVENAVVHAERADPTVTLSATADETTATVTVADDGPGLPADARDTLLSPGLPEYDDPTTGFGLTIVRLLTAEYGADVDVDADGTGTDISLTFRRADADRGVGRLGVPGDRVVDAVVASLVAGVAMGVVFEAITGGLEVIGALYGASHPVVGWVTHLFHSVVFGVAFVALAHGPRLGDRLDSLPAKTVAGAGWGLFLWLFAASLVMPVWLRFVGVAVPVPLFDPVTLAAHLLWGAVLGGSLAVLDRR